MEIRVNCGTCLLRALCLPPGLSRAELDSAEQMVSTRVRVPRGVALVRAGDAFRSLYAIRLGSMKSTLFREEARHQVTGFHMAGDLIGFDAMGTGSHACDLAALEDSEVCVIPYSRLEDCLGSTPALRSHLHAAMSREIARQRESMLMLGSMQADERLATFLLDLSERFARRGYSSRQFMLRMSRAEMGSFLGLTLETVCRLLSQFARDGLIEVQHAKSLTILDPDRLRRRATGPRPATPPGSPGGRAAELIVLEPAEVILTRARADRPAGAMLPTH